MAILTSDKIKEVERGDAWISDFMAYLKTNTRPYLKDLERHLNIIATISYIVGVALIIIRQHMVGLPFSVTNVFQAIVVATYFLGLSMYSLYANYVIMRLRENKINIEDRKNYGLIWIVLTFILFIALLVLLGNASVSILLSFSYSYCVTKLPKWMPFEVAVAIVIGLNAITIFCIPSDMGGLRSQTVLFCRNDSQDSCSEYEYYGTTDGLYQLSNQAGTYLIPVDQGYIQLH